MNAVVLLSTAFLCKLIRRKVIFTSRCLSIPVTVWSVLSDVENSGMEKVSSTAEMYLRFSAESFVSPHVQYITPVLQCLRHTLHCHFGSTLTISQISVFPASMIATFDSSLNALNVLLLFEVILKCFLLWMTCDSLNLIMNVKVFRTFHCFVRNAGNVEINVLIVRRKVELIRIITIFEMTIFLHFVQFFLSIKFP